MLAVCSLFASVISTDQTLTFSDLTVFGGLIGTAAGGAWTVAALLHRSKIGGLKYQVEALKRRTQTLEDDRGDDKKEIARLTADRNREHKRALNAEAQVAEVKKKLYPYYHAYTKLKPQADQDAKELGDAKEQVKKLTDTVGDGDAALKAAKEHLEKTRADLDGREKDLKRTARRINKALRLQGNLWTAKALQQVPKFRPLADRNRAIVSVVNLKGGVGKTTITAQLGVALARRGYRVLMIDLDLQGSLTNMFLTFDQSHQLSQEQKLLHHFLQAAAKDFTTSITDYTRPVYDDPDSGGAVELVPTSDHLAYAELSLTLQWLLRQGERDTRFLLRKALHRVSLKHDHDIVLLDCPPLANISCVNALAASDYVVVPTTMSAQATARVPVLLKRFVVDPTFRKYINPGLKVLGVVANRTRGEQLNGPESAVWNQLGVWCHDAAGADVKRFQAVIPEQARDLRDVEAGQSIPAADTRLAKTFAAVAAEVEQELPNGCRRSAQAPV